MTKRRTMLVAASLLGVAACSSGSASPAGPVTDQVVPSGSTDADDGASGSRSDGATDDLVVWSEADTIEVLRSVAATFTETTGVDVLVEEVQLDEVYDMVVGGGRPEGRPDVFIGRHVWAGELVADDLVVPVALDAARDRFLDVALAGFNVGGRTYAVPATAEAMALYRNTDLVADAPATWDGLRAACDAAAADTCLAVPGGSDDPDAYAQFVFLSAFGGFLFGYDDATGFDPAVVGIDADDTVEGAGFLERQVADGIIPDTAYVDAKQRFVDGEAAFWLSGPWELAALADTDVAFDVSTIPPIGDAPARAFVGATGWYVSADSPKVDLAQRFLLEHVAADDTQADFVASGVADSAWSAVVRSLPEGSPERVFAEAVSAGVAIPNIEEMADVWDPLGDQLAALRRGDVSAAEALAVAAAEVRAAD
jgi:maltose-binding protein MalE